MRFISIIIPGLLVAATGVGAGDLATASIVGSLLGVSILWAVVVGGAMKFFLTEGIGRWQIATGTTLLQGVKAHFGRFWGLCFFPYLILWSFFVGAALISACGVTLNSLLPIFADPFTGKLVFGTVCSLAGVLFIRIGGFRFFEKVMGFCIALMFITVISTAAVLWPSTSEVLAGVFVPKFTPLHKENINWIIALIGGVGGTVTILCYGYWIQEKGRAGIKAINICRLDLAVGYGATVIFGIAMVIIGSHIQLSGSGANLLVQLALKLDEAIGVWGKWIFLIGAFGAVFSSLLGVWQAVPMLIVDTWRLFVIAKPTPIKILHADTQNSAKQESPITSIYQSFEYKISVIALAVFPLAGLFFSFKSAQKYYAFTGSLFMPLVAIALLIMNNSKLAVEFRNGMVTNIALVATLLFFGYIALVG